MKGKLYTSNRWIWEDGHHYKEMSDDEFLFNGNNQKSKYRREDLPEWYIPGYYFKLNGYLSAKGVKDLKYKPAPLSINHLFRDDGLYVSYGDEITLRHSDDILGNHYTGYYICFGGPEMIDFVKAVEKYSELDCSDIKKQITKKAKEWMKEWPGEDSVDVDSLWE